MIYHRRLAASPPPGAGPPTPAGSSSGERTVPRRALALGAGLPLRQRPGRHRRRRRRRHRQRLALHDRARQHRLRLGLLRARVRVSRGPSRSYVYRLHAKGVDTRTVSSQLRLPCCAQTARRTTGSTQRPQASASHRWPETQQAQTPSAMAAGGRRIPGASCGAARPRWPRPCRAPAAPLPPPGPPAPPACTYIGLGLWLGQQPHHSHQARHSAAAQRFTCGKGQGAAPRSKSSHTWGHPVSAAAPGVNCQLLARPSPQRAWRWTAMAGQKRAGIREPATRSAWLRHAGARRRAGRAAADALKSAGARHAAGTGGAPVKQHERAGRRVQRGGVLGARGAAGRGRRHDRRQEQVALAGAAVGVLRVGVHARRVQRACRAKPGSELMRKNLCSSRCPPCWCARRRVHRACRAKFSSDLNAESNAAVGVLHVGARPPRPPRLPRQSISI
jgi:hypothetical protein